MLHVWRREKICREFWLGNLKEGIRLENTGLVGRIMLKQIIKKQDM
jgi:hypothetical protein